MSDPRGILLILAIVVPAGFALLSLIRPIRRPISLGAVLITLYIAFRIFFLSRPGPILHSFIAVDHLWISLYADTLSSLIVISCSFFATLLILYSPTALEGYPAEGLYLFYIMMTLAAANGVCLAHNLFLVVFFWGILVALLYGMMMISRKDPTRAAQKAFLIIGISDISLLLGFIIIFSYFGVATIILENPLRLDHPLVVLSFILIIIGALAKAGAMPLHTWIPEAAKVAPASTMAFVPASLDKLLGIYLLVRASYFIFDLTSSMPLKILLLSIGSVTIVAAALMALIQREGMKLLSFSTVSQVGYMVLGIGTGIPVGIAGGLFHMVNHAIYKSCLFLSAGSVEHRTKTTKLEQLGGLGTKMPVTFLSFLIAAFAISGVPPFNGFYSKWLVYQGVIELSRETKLWPIFLIAAMFGSILTLAASLKMLHSLFLGDRPKTLDKTRETSYTMCMPSALLATLCIVFGVFALQLPLRFFIYPSLPFYVAKPGFWAPTLAAILIIIGLVLGLVIFLLGTASRPKKSPIFVGGEIMAEELARIPGTEFYSSIKEMKFLTHLYENAEGGVYDLYNALIKFAESLSDLVFKYIDRLIDKFILVITEIVRFLGSTLGSLSAWFILILVICLLNYATTRTPFSLQTFAFMLLLGGPLLALVEDNLIKFLLAITAGQSGLILLSFGSNHPAGTVIGIYQLINSLIGLELIYIGIKTAINLTGKIKIDDMRGLVKNTGVTAIGFIIGGLMLSCLPPSPNFLSKFLTSLLYENSRTALFLISIFILLNLAAFLRVFRKVYLGQTTITVRKKFGSEEVLVLFMIILSIILILRLVLTVHLELITGGY